MKPVLTADEYRRVDKAYEGDLIQAMDRAAYAVALATARAGAGYGKRVVVLAGPGNNGGDGYVAARYLKARGADVEVQALAPPKTTEAIDAATNGDAVGVRIVELGEPDDSNVIFDALFGGGTDYIAGGRDLFRCGRSPGTILGMSRDDHSRNQFVQRLRWC